MAIDVSVPSTAALSEAPCPPADKISAPMEWLLLVVFLTCLVTLWMIRKLMIRIDEWFVAVRALAPDEEGDSTDDPEDDDPGGGIPSCDPVPYTKRAA